MKKAIPAPVPRITAAPTTWRNLRIRYVKNGFSRDASMFYQAAAACLI
jgi:hypothetical protein